MPVVESVIEILGPEGAVGRGALIDNVVVTCAHVVCDALGIGRSTEDRPQAQLRIRLTADTSSDGLPAEIGYWSHTDAEDLAVLHPAKDLEVRHPTRTRSSVDVGELVRFLTPAAGLPMRWASAEVEGQLSDGLLQIKRRGSHGHWISPGASGSPLFDVSGNMVGIVRSKDVANDISVGTAISIERIQGCTSLEFSAASDWPAAAEYRDRVARFAGSRLSMFSPLFRLGVLDEEQEAVRLSDGIVSGDAGLRRVVLEGDGGSGKSQFLAALADLLVVEGWVPVWVDLSGWSELDTQQLQDTDLDAAEILLRHAADSSIDLSRAYLREIDDGVLPFAFIVDALNEVGEPRDSISEHPRVTILRTMSEILRLDYPNRSVAVLATRGGSVPDYQQWTRLQLAPIDSEVVESTLANAGIMYDSETVDGRTAELLKSPFFLNFAIESKSIDFDSIYTALSKRIGEPSQVLGKLALLMYTDFRTTSLEWSAIDSTSDALEDEDREWLLDSAGSLRFRHQLVQDFFAASAAAEQWSQRIATVGTTYAGEDPISDDWLDVFEGISFGGTTDHCLLMVAEMLETQDPDLLAPLLNWVYDWNYSMTLNVLASSVEGDGLSDLAFAVGALQSARRFDSVESTVELAGPQFERLANRYPHLNVLRATTHDELHRSVEHHFNPQATWGGRWKTAFLTESVEELLELVGDGAALVGWTAANVIKRQPLSADAEKAALVSLRAHRVPLTVDNAYHKTVRWRLVYVLGSGELDDSEAILFEALSDRYHWVRSGSLRSLLERLRRNGDSSKTLQQRLLLLIPNFDSRLRSRLARSLKGAGGELAEIREELLNHSEDDEVARYQREWGLQ